MYRDEVHQVHVAHAFAIMQVRICGVHISYTASLQMPQALLHMHYGISTRLPEGINQLHGGERHARLLQGCL